MSLTERIKQNAKEVSDSLAGTPDYFRQSPLGIALLKDLEPVLTQYVSGRTLDAGAGRLAYRDLLLTHANEVIACDLRPSGKLLDAAADLERLPFADSCFDTIFCSQVLEHVKDPWQAAAEMARALRPGGCLIITVPFVGYLHNEPHDYHRFTPHGARSLLEQTGLEAVHVSGSGGPFAFTAHLMTSSIISLTFAIPILGRGIFRLMAWGNSLIEWMDRRLPGKKLMPANVIAVGRKVS